METQQTKGCGCAKKIEIPEQIINLDNYHNKMIVWNESQKELAELIRAVHQRRKKIRSK